MRNTNTHWIIAKRSPDVSVWSSIFQRSTNKKNDERTIKLEDHDHGVCVYVCVCVCVCTRGSGGGTK